MSPKLAAGDTGKFAFLAGIAGGSARRAIFVTRDTARNREHNDHASVTADPSGGAAAGHAHRHGDQHNPGPPRAQSTFPTTNFARETKTLDPSGQATLTTSSSGRRQDSSSRSMMATQNFARDSSTLYEKVDCAPWRPWVVLGHRGGEHDRLLRHRWGLRLTERDRCARGSGRYRGHKMALRALPPAIPARKANFPVSPAAKLRTHGECRQDSSSWHRITGGHHFHQCPVRMGDKHSIC